MMTGMVDIDAIRAYAQAELERWQVPAVEVVAIQDGEPKPWSETFLTAHRSLPQPTEPETVEGTRPSPPLESYGGDYVHPAYGMLQVELDHAELRVRLSELELQARYRHYDTWTVVYEPLEIMLAMTFITNADGNVCAAELPLEPSVAPIRFDLVAREADA